MPVWSPAGGRATPSCIASPTPGSSRRIDSSRTSRAREAHKKGEWFPDGGDQGRDRPEFRGARPQVGASRRGRLLGGVVRAVQDGRTRDGEARGEVRRDGGRREGRRRREPGPV